MKTDPNSLNMDFTVPTFEYHYFRIVVSIEFKNKLRDKSLTSRQACDQVFFYFSWGGGMGNAKYGLHVGCANL